MVKGDLNFKKNISAMPQPAQAVKPRTSGPRPCRGGNPLLQTDMKKKAGGRYTNKAHKLFKGEKKRFQGRRQEGVGVLGAH